MGRRIVVGTLALLLAMPLTASATTLQFNATVKRTLAAEETSFGGCMVFLSVSPATEGLNCNPGGNWVTFDCAGDYLGKASALRMFDSAQLAFMTGRTVRVWVDDTRKHNGWCLVERIDVFAQ